MTSVALALVGCRGGEESEVRNLLLVTLDTTRADHLGCYGHDRAETPNLDDLATHGVLFERCIAVSPVTLPSHASILTGLYPYHHGARNNVTHYLPDRAATLAEILSRSGFATGAVVSAMVLDSRYGLDQGFDRYDDDLAGGRRPLPGRFRETAATDTVRRARRWLEERGDERWCLWVHFFDPHETYQAPEPFAALHPDSPYDAEIAYVDSALGQLFGVLGAGELERTLVVVAADHGESLGEHGENTHSVFLYDATTRVPLILAHPALVQGKRVVEVVSQVDVLPTVLELLEVPAPDVLDGRSLAPTLLEAAVRPDVVPAYSETLSPRYNFGWSELRALRDEHMRYVSAPRPELYDLSRDPFELVNLHEDKKDLARFYARRLVELLPDEEADVRGESVDEMDPQVRESLAALGYVFLEGVDPDRELAARPDPKDVIHVFDRYREAKVLLTAGRYAEAEVVLRAVVDELPGRFAFEALVQALLAQEGREEEVLELLRRAAGEPGAPSGTLLNLARMERALGLESWKDSVARAKERDPHDPRPWTCEANWALESGDTTAALAGYRKALELDERHAEAWGGIGVAESRRGNRGAAEKALRRAVEADPLLADAWFNLGVLCEEDGRPEEAMASYRKVRELEPDEVRAWINMGGLHLATDDAARAEDCFEAALEIDPEDFDANQNMGGLRMLQGEHREAAEYFLRATRVRPESERSWFGRMRACRASGDGEGALQAAERLVELAPDDFASLRAAVVASDALGRSEEAEAYLRRLRELDAARVDESAARDPRLRAVLERLR